MRDDPLPAEHARPWAERIPATIALSCPVFDLSCSTLDEAVAAHAAGPAGAGVDELREYAASLVEQSATGRRLV